MLFNTFIAAAALATSAFAQQINSPAALIECQPAALAWSGGQSPYIVAVIPGGQASAPALTTLVSGSTATSYTWNVNLAAGTSITLRLTDGAGAIAYSSPITIQAGSSQSCLNATATSAAGAAGVVGSASRSGTASVSGASSAAAVSGASSAAAVSVSSASGAASSAVSAAASSVSGASSSAAGVMSSISSAVRPSSSSGASSGASTPVSSGAAAATSSRSAGDRLAAPGLVLAAVGGLLALF